MYTYKEYVHTHTCIQAYKTQVYIIDVNIVETLMATWTKKQVF